MNKRGVNQTDDFSLLPLSCWRCLLGAFMALSMAACTLPNNTRRTVYPDGFLVVTRTVLLAHLEGQGPSRVINNSDTITRREIIYDHIKTVPNMRKVPNLLDHGFGVLALIQGLPDGETTLTLDIQHPPFQMPNGETRTHFTRAEKVKSLNARAFWDFAYFFNHAYEQRPGPWMLSLKYRDRLIYQERIEVIAATPPAP